MPEEKIQNIVRYLGEMKTDSTVPKNVKLKMDEVIVILNSDSEVSMKVDRAVHIFDKLNEDSNIDSFTRTQLWNVVSLIESIE